MRGGPDGHPDHQGSSPAEVSYEAEALEIEREFQRKLAGLRRRLRPSEIPAAVRVLREKKQAALEALRNRRAVERRAERKRRELTRKPFDSPVIK